MVQLPYWPPSSQQVSHSRWICGIHAQAMEHARGDIIKSRKHQYQCPNKIQLMYSEKKLKKNICIYIHLVFHNCWMVFQERLLKNWVPTWFVILLRILSGNFMESVDFANGNSLVLPFKNINFEFTNSIDLQIWLLNFCWWMIYQYEELLYQSNVICVYEISCAFCMM